MQHLVAAERVLQGTAATISVTFADQNGEPAVAGGAVTVDVTKADGTVLVTAGTGTADSITPGRYTAVLTAAQTANLQTLTCVWKDTGVVRSTSLVDVVGGFYFSIAQAVAFDSSLEDPGKYPVARMQQVRREVVDECELITGTAWVPQFRRWTTEGPGFRGASLPVRGGGLSTLNRRAGTLILPDWAPRRIVSIRVYTGAVDYTTFTQPDLDSLGMTEGGVVERRDLGVFLPGVQNVTVEYEHGYDRPPPDLVHACLTRLRVRLNMESRGVSDYATAFVQQGGGTFTLAQPGRAGYETGIPEVDAVYLRHSKRIPGMA